MKPVIILFLFILSISHTKAQNGARALKTGDKVPAIHLQNILNYKGGTAALPELQNGKLLLIDFWGTYCGPCIKFMPALDSLQEEFKDKVQVVSVTTEDTKTIQDFLKSKGRDTRYIYYVVEDTLLEYYFPHQMIPHFAWIGIDGKLIATTDDREVTAENIKNILKGNNIAMVQKNDDISFDYTKPYVPDGSLIKYRSLLTKSDARLSSGGLIDPLLIKPDIHYADSLRRIFLWNDDMTALYYTAFSRYTCNFPNFNRIILETADNSRFILPKYRDKNRRAWEAANLYSYELMTDTLTDGKTFFTYMWDDLNRSLPVKATIEKRNIPCWVITDSAKKKELWQTAGGKETIEWHFGGVLYKLQNKTIDELMLYLNSFPNSLPVIDETGITERVDLILDIETDAYALNIDKLKQSLSRYGLAITQLTKNIDVIVIRDK